MRVTRKQTKRSRRSVLLVAVLGFLVATTMTNFLFFGAAGEESTIYKSTRAMFSVTNSNINKRNVKSRIPEKGDTRDLLGNSRQDGSAKEKNCVYSKQRPDRSGAVIVDMMAAHAFAHQRRKKYCGACGESAHQAQTKALIQVLGLQAELPLLDECPAAGASSSNSIQPYDRNFTNEWRLYMKDRMRRFSSDPHNGPHKVAVHVRRGDVKPGTYAFYGKAMYDRYLPNSYYLDVIKNYKQPDSQVLIFCEEEESLSEFATRGYQLHTNASAEEAWRNFLDCDVLITSRSEFSYAPALFTRALTVVSPTFWVPTMSDWIVTNPSR